MPEKYTRGTRPVFVSGDGLTAKIPLRRMDGTVLAYAIIDATDALWASQWSWCLDRGCDGLPIGLDNPPGSPRFALR